MESDTKICRWQTSKENQPLLLGLEALNPISGNYIKHFR